MCATKCADITHNNKERIEANEESYLSDQIRMYSDQCIYNNGNHSAFTCLTEYKGNKYLAFREGIGHRPVNTDHYGIITILSEKDSVWSPLAKLSNSDMDLRDPFFLIIHKQKNKAFALLISFLYFCIAI